jgi:hypothetical protein
MAKGRARHAPRAAGSGSPRGSSGSSISSSGKGNSVALGAKQPSISRASPRGPATCTGSTRPAMAMAISMPGRPQQ